MTSPFRFGYLAMRPAPTKVEFLDQVRFAEDAGFSTFQQSDHFDRTPLSPLLALAAAAQVSSRIRLGTLVLDNDFRHPSMLAKEAATLDLLCDGRLELGIGAGWMTADYAVSGIAFDPPSVRINRLRDTVAIVKAVLGSDEPATLATKHVTIEAMRSVPLPIQRPHPPLLLGGGGKRMLTLAGQQADIVGVNLMLVEGRVGPRALRRAQDDATREKLSWVAEAAAGRAVAPLLHLNAFWTAVSENPLEAAKAKIAEGSLDTSPEGLLDSPHCLIGPKSALIERLHQLREQYGISYISFYDAVAADVADIVAELVGT